MDLSLRAITLRPEPTPAKGFFRLPWELRQRIFELSLIELPKWEKLHKADCPLIAKDTHSCERPPFVDKTLLYTPLPGCLCARRHSLNVLLANRQIYREAAPVFWSRNVFCFTRVDQFHDEVGTQMRTAHRLMLRHVSILLYTNDSVPNKNYLNLTRSGEALWDTLLQCNSLRTLELSHGLLDSRLAHVSRVKKQLPQLESFRITTLMAYRVWPRRDQSEPERRTWTSIVGAVAAAGARPPGQTGGHGHGNDNDNNTPPPPPPPAFIPFADATVTPPPPPAEHYVVLNPILAGYDCNAHRDLSRVLWIKAGIELDVDAAAETPVAYTDMMRNYQTNFLVHLRHELAKLPEAWARDYHDQPPPPLPRRNPNQFVSDDSDSDNNVAIWDPMHGVSRHSPEAIRLVCGRLPAHLRDEPVTEYNITLRDGRRVPVQIMGLPVSKSLRTRRFLERQRIKRAQHAAGGLTAREEVVQKELQERRETKQRILTMAERRDAAREMANRKLRNANREGERREEERAARAEERSRAAEAQEALLALRQAARKRRSAAESGGDGTANESEEEYDEGSEADTEEDEDSPKSKSKSASPRNRLKPAKAISPKSKNKKQGKVVRGRPSRNSGRAEINYRLRVGDYDE